MPAPRKYPLELRERAVRMYRASEPKPVIRRMAEELGVHHEALRGWIRQAEADAGERDDLLTSDERAGLVALRKENAQLKRSNEVLRTASAFSRHSSTRPGPGDRALRRARRPGGRAHPPGTEHPSSTYYRWRRARREPCERRRRDAELTEQIRRVHEESGGTYGSPRVHAALKRENVYVGRKRVERLIREADLAGISLTNTLLITELTVFWPVNVVIVSGCRAAAWRCLEQGIYMAEVLGRSADLRLL
ncbi:hypothetical protein GCM10020295_00390 [Streptomyces cinereospinus]